MGEMRQAMAVRCAVCAGHGWVRNEAADRERLRLPMVPCPACVGSGWEHDRGALDVGHAGVVSVDLRFADYSPAEIRRATAVR